MASPKFMLLERMYPGDLMADMQTMLDDGVSWRDIAIDVSHRSKLSVSHETLRAWFRDMAPERARTDLAS